ncbi:O-succinylbenzoate synthase [Oikeobacillus pervagus]|uniref:o-succinylbenzoate synthase n=1 Tax=Oikeobacillus pervagus TaxID=1325931 RepID=A0AAJ1T7I1_9BACI|nr:o-succinylbenzoate synthase [Oikeobacillus pervagus]MDQ0216561.1 O-succinylbenzoate synthase [Oikeobacillus pervagus]
MNIKHIHLHIIQMKLKSPFITHLEHVTDRKGIILKVIDDEGNIGVGEAVAFTTPWYTEETVQTCYHMIKDILFPLIRQQNISSPENVSTFFLPVRGNQMAKAAIETAIWDLWAKRENKTLASVLGGKKKVIEAGAVVGASSVEKALEQTNRLVEKGFKRIKVKIHPGLDIELVEQIRKNFPDLLLMADANSAYSLADIERLKVLDEYDLLMIEQPLAFDDIVQHSYLQKEIKTPICLDESIHSIRDVENAISLSSCQVINIKIGRVGGLNEAKKIYQLCMQHGLDVWVGGMIEFGVSRACNVALSTLEGIHIPGDIMSSNHYWEEDIIEPGITVSNGQIRVSDEIGMGYQLNEKRLQQVSVFEEILS